MYANGENDSQNTHTQKLKYCHSIYSNLQLPLQFWQHLRHTWMCMYVYIFKGTSTRENVCFLICRPTVQY